MARIPKTAPRKPYPHLEGSATAKPLPSFTALDWLAWHDALWVEEWRCFVVRAEGDHCHRLLPPEKLAKKMARWAVRKFPALRVTSSFCRDMAWNAAALAEPSHQIDPPVRHAAFTDCVLDLYTLEKLPIGSHPTVIGFDLALADVEKAEGPMWDEYLETVFVDSEGNHDPALLASFHEAAGTLLLASRAVSCAVFLYGPTAANGKSTMLDVLTGTLGRHLCSAMSIASLTDNRFALSNLIAKLFNFCGEIGSRYAKHDTFKSVVTGDLVSAEFKFGETLDYVPHVRLWFAVNAIPTWDGVDAGLIRRMRAFRFGASFKGKQEGRAAARIVKNERAAVLRWLLDGARKLRDNGYAFSDEADAAIGPMMEEFERESSAVRRFVTERGWRHDQDTVPVKTADIYADYRRWCDDAGSKPSNDNNFMTEFRRVTGCGDTFDHRHDVIEKGVTMRKMLKSLRMTRTEKPEPCRNCADTSVVCTEHGMGQAGMPNF